jgi:hypothetical protein
MAPTKDLEIKSILWMAQNLGLTIRMGKRRDELKEIEF